jgi:hypothetical protein
MTRTRKLICAAAVLLFGLIAAPALAQFNQVIPDGPLGVPHQPESVIDLGQLFGAAAPYIDETVNALIALGVSWLGYLLHKRFNITIDQGHRDALTRALQNQANSLIADGAVSLKGKTVSIQDDHLLQAVTDIQASIPGAVKHFGITPEYLAKRITDTIPQVPAGAQMMPSATATPAPSA